MNRDEYAALTKNATGRAVRQFLGNAANREPDTSRTRLREVLVAHGIDDEALQDKLLDRYKKIAEKGRKGESLFQLRQHADLEAVAVMREIRSGDDLFGDHGIPAATVDDRKAAHDLARTIDTEDPSGTRQLVDDLNKRANAAERARTGTV